jgi:hypothetical protein
MAALQSGEFETAQKLISKLSGDHVRDDLFRSHDEEVICDVVLVTGKSVRGQFSYVDNGTPPGWASFTLYDNGDDRQPERWLHINPAHIVSIQVWLD